MAIKLNKKTLIARELAPLSKGSMMQFDPKKAQFSEIVTSYAILNRLGKVIEARKNALKPILLAQATSLGEATDKGHRVLEVDGEVVTRERKLSSAPNEEKLRALLATHSIPLLECFDEVKKVVLNPSRLEYLVSVGKLDAEAVEALREESFSCKVEEGPELEALLEEAWEAEPEKTVSTAKKRATR